MLKTPFWLPTTLTDTDVAMLLQQGRFDDPELGAADGPRTEHDSKATCGCQWPHQCFCSVEEAFARHPAGPGPSTASWSALAGPQSKRDGCFKLGPPLLRWGWLPALTIRILQRCLPSRHEVKASEGSGRLGMSALPISHCSAAPSEEEACPLRPLDPHTRQPRPRDALGIVHSKHES